MIPSMTEFSKARVLVVGDVMLDRYWSGDTERISPEAPVPVVRVRQMEERPGGAANVALNAAALGARVSLLGLAGADAEADVLQQQLDAAGIDCRLRRLAGVRTITKLRVLSRHQQLLRLDFEQSFDAEAGAHLRADLQSLVHHADVLLLSDYAKGTLAGIEELIALAHAARLPVLVDPKGRDFARYRGATVLTPNQQEFEAVVGACTSEAELERQARRLLLQLDLQALLITRGERGMSLIACEQPALHLPARALEVFDVTGAGDTVIATLATALAAGDTLADATVLANAAAGIVVGKLGAAVLSVTELGRSFAAGRATDHGVLDREQLLAAVSAARARGERIVMSNGCFDLLHAGHVAYLRQARSLGERLLVAVNDDASVTRLKGAGRPINPLQRRMAVLAGLGSVDWVTGFAEDTPEALLALVRPDVLVKGGDYAADEVVGRELVESWGGSVAVLDLVEGCSTTAMLARVPER
jgi:D-beta-D-heptose 7-phosphate kinase / D-beta-D-heptose 1-phosphate adenosyltransferase